jgi:hypothetical protein
MANKSKKSKKGPPYYQSPKDVPHYNTDPFLGGTVAVYAASGIMVLNLLLVIYLIANTSSDPAANEAAGFGYFFYIVPVVLIALLSLFVGLLVNVFSNKLPGKIKTHRYVVIGIGLLIFTLTFLLLTSD